MESACQECEPNSHTAQGSNVIGRLLEGGEVFRLITLSRTTVWRRVQEGRFPAPVSLGTTRTDIFLPAPHT